MTKQILQIIPTPPNSSDGIGDYALLLAAQLLEDAQINTQFLVFRNDIKVANDFDGFSAVCLSIHQSKALCSLISERTKAVIVHFSSYPYFNTSLKGILGFEAPFWFVGALQSLQRTRNLKLIVMFHELPKLHWKQFYFFDYLNPIHSFVSRGLAQIADTVLTNSSKYQKILSKWVKHPVDYLPIFSNMGELDAVLPLLKRKRRMIIFGGSARQRVYQKAFKELVTTCFALRVEEICDIGPPLNLHVISDFGEIPLIEMGFQSKEVITQLLRNSIAGCLDYTPFPGDLGKSGVFAAYCSHGMLPICTLYNPSEADGLHLNQHYLVLDKGSDHYNFKKLQNIADTAYQWYQSHTLSKVSNIFAYHILK